MERRRKRRIDSADDEWNGAPRVIIIDCTDWEYIREQKSKELRRKAVFATLYIKAKLFESHIMKCLLGGARIERLHAGCGKKDPLLNKKKTGGDLMAAETAECVHTSTHVCAARCSEEEVWWRQNIDTGGEETGKYTPKSSRALPVSSRLNAPSTGRGGDRS